MPPVIGNAVNAARSLVSGAPDVPISREYVTNLPYASIAAKIGRGPRSLLTLGRYDGPDLHWISADDVAVVTRNGRVIRTAGIAVGLRDTQGLNDDPVTSGTFDFDGIHTRIVDLEDLTRTYGVPISSAFEVVGRETITILERDYDTLAVREFNDAATIRWAFQNFFWFDFQTGFMWKSEQHFARNTPPLEIEVLKPAL